MPGKTLSVIMPNFNDAEFIGTALRAVCEQSFQPHEVIVVDNCSTDNSFEIIKQMAAKHACIRVLQNDTNRGSLYSCNRAFKIATGDYLYVASANDLIYPGFFERSMRMLAEHPEAGLCCSDFEVITVKDGTSVVSKWMPKAGYFTPSKLADMAATSQTTFSAGPNSIFRRDCLPADELYIQEIEGFSDWFLSKVIAFRYGCCYLPEPLVAVRWIDGSYTDKMYRNAPYFQSICVKVIRLFASLKYEDIAPLIIRSRSLRNIRYSMRAPLAVFKALYGASKRNTYTHALFFHLLAEYVCSVSAPARQRLTPLMQSIHDFLISTLYFQKNLADQAYAKSFHKYYRLKQLVRKQ